MTRKLRVDPDGATLEGPAGTLWDSADDESFADEFPDSLDENDIPDILDYLVEEDYLTDDQRGHVECFYADDDDDDDDDEASIADDDGDEY